MSIFDIVRLEMNAWTDLGAGNARLYAGEGQIFYASGDCAPADISAGKALGRRCCVSVQTSQRIWARSGSTIRDGQHIFVLGHGAILPGEKVPLDLNGRHIISEEEIFSAIFPGTWLPRLFGAHFRPASPMKD
jgi:hypothetical protein